MVPRAAHLRFLKKDASGPEGPSVGGMVGDLDGQAEACPDLLPPRGQVRSRFPDGNDRLKNNGKGNSRSFALLRMTSRGVVRAFVSPTLAAKDASRMGYPLWW